MPAYDDRRFDPPAPLAIVSLRNPRSGKLVSDIPMLIDSGADMSLVPRTIIAELNLQLAQSERYQIEAFDGSKSLAEVIQLDMLFLGRTVRGRYLVLDSEIGILGRDVLNHFTVTLDGPGLHWRQMNSGQS